MALAKRDLQPLKQWFENIAIEETTGKQVAGAVIGEVFVRKAVAGICLRTCEEYKPCHESDDPQMITKYSEVIHTLLHSVEYEVRSAVLEFIICQQLPSELNTRLDCEITPHTPDSRTASWIFGELESQNLKTQLLTMAMETEHHVDCLVKVPCFCLLVVCIFEFKLHSLKRLYIEYSLKISKTPPRRWYFGIKLVFSTPRSPLIILLTNQLCTQP